MCSACLILVNARVSVLHVESHLKHNTCRAFGKKNQRALERKRMPLQMSHHQLWSLKRTFSNSWQGYPRCYPSRILSDRRRDDQARSPRETFLDLCCPRCRMPGMLLDPATVGIVGSTWCSTHRTSAHRVRSSVTVLRASWQTSPPYSVSLSYSI